MRKGKGQSGPEDGRENEEGEEAGEEGGKGVYLCGRPVHSLESGFSCTRVPCVPGSDGKMFPV
eukprot:618549-Rhodomonas_salina.2